MAWVKSGRIEKKVISEHKKLAGTSDIDAKVLYVKAARSLPTFGVHFFLVKVSEMKWGLANSPKSRRRVASSSSFAALAAPTAADGT